MKLTQEEWIERFRSKHGNKYKYYDFDVQNTSKQKIKINCPIHGDFFQTPKEHFKGKGCIKCGKESSAKKQALTQEECIKRFITTHGKEAFDYSKVKYVKQTEKVLIGCKNYKKHKGIFWFYQSPVNHWKGYGCPECSAEKGGRKRTVEEFIEKSKEINGDKYDYSLVEYTNNKTPVKLICKKHNFVFEQSPNNHISKKQGCPICNESSGEKNIEKYLKDNNIIFEVQKTFRDLKDRYSLSYDFYLPNYNLLIEYNGIQHYKPINFFGGYKSFLLQKHHDWLKRKYTRKNGIKLLTISYLEFDNINKIITKYLQNIEEEGIDNKKILSCFKNVLKRCS